MGPLPTPRGSADVCSLSIAHLGYVLASYAFDRSSAQLGDLGLSCKGCNCSSIAGSFGSELRPFPIVPTRMDAQSTSGTMFDTLNASVRASTSFWVQQRPDEACFLQVQHQPAAPLLPPGIASSGATQSTTVGQCNSQVQVTSLALAEAAPSDVVGMWMRMHWFKMRRFVHSTARCILTEQSALGKLLLLDVLNCSTGQTTRPRKSAELLNAEQKLWLSTRSAKWRRQVCTTGSVPGS